MESEIKRLVEKYNRELALNEQLYTMVESSSLTKGVIEDLQSLLKFKRLHMEKQDILDMVKYARHIHVAGDGNNIDTCKKCGHDIHHGIHFRYGENINEYTKDKTDSE